jgi:hypothetical protein
MLVQLLDALIRNGQIVPERTRLDLSKDEALRLVAQRHAVLIEAEPEPVKGPEPTPAPAPVAPRTRGAKR